MTHQQLKEQGFTEITEAEAQRRMLNGIPGVVFIDMRHDSWCRTLKTQRGSDCTCNPDQHFFAMEGETE